MKKIGLILFFMLLTMDCVPWTASYAAETLTILTYYPAPYGVYKTLQIGQTDHFITIDYSTSPATHRIFSNNTNDILLSHDGTTNDLIVDTTGNIGIGITTGDPLYKLDVDGDINISVIPRGYKQEGYTILTTSHTNKNIFIGEDVGTVTTGGYNLFCGFNAGKSNTSGYTNAFIGTYAGSNNTEGIFNTFIGNYSGSSNKKGNNNVFIGCGAGYFNQVGNNNVFIGYTAGFYETGSNKLYIANGSESSNVLIYGDFSNDYVGINKINPSATLHVGGEVKIETMQNYRNSRNVYWGDSHLDKLLTYYDLAELFNTNEEVESGDVLVIDNNGNLKKSDSPYDKRVAGIVSSAPAIIFEGSQLQLAPQPFEFKKGNKPPVALSGRVYVNASIENGPIEPGDLLTTSSTPGHAMKAKPIVEINGCPIYPQGCIVGKALEPLKEGKGKILVLVCLM